MAELRIERGGHKVAFLSKFHVEVDGQELAQLKHGESATLDVSSGTHSLHVHATGMNDGSTEVEVPEDGTKLIVGSKQSIGSATKSSFGSKGLGGNKTTIEFWSADDAG